MNGRMRREDRRAQLLEIAAREFADRGLYGASMEAIAREAGIAQAYVFQIFGSKKALFLELVTNAFDQVAAALYAGAPAGRTALMLQLQAFATCADPGIQNLVRQRTAQMWSVITDTTSLDAVAVKSFLALGLIQNLGIALDLDDVHEPWADGLRTRIHPGLFAHITTQTNA